jgi:hypothetical protein
MYANAFDPCHCKALSPFANEFAGLRLSQLTAWRIVEGENSS